MRTVVVLLVACALGAPAAAQWLHQPTQGIPRTPDGKPNLSAPAPRTADGRPDLSGLWNKISPTYGRNLAADLEPEEIAPSARELVAERRENLGKDYMNVKCVPLGPGYVTAADITGAEMMKIVQTPLLLLILNPDLTYRQIFTDGRALEPDPNPTWMGYSVGRWEGDTLIVDSFGFNDRSWLDHDGNPHTEQLRITERYRRTDFGHLEIEVTFEDPAVYARPWTVAVRAELAADTEMLEWVCNDSDHHVERWVGKASDDLKNEVAVEPSILAQYVGTYVEQPPFWRTAARVVEVSFVDGRLFADMDGRGLVRLIAGSETGFSGLYGLDVLFTPGGSELFVKHVSGDYRFLRK
jgi:hypothetical protein